MASSLAPAPSAAPFRAPLFVLTPIVWSVTLFACGSDGTIEADAVGVAAECSDTTDCATYVLPDQGVMQLQCLPAFRGGYCAVPDCSQSAECPDGSVCVAHTDGQNYCLRRCDDKPECNENRSLDNEANCSSNFDWALPSEDDGAKACIPPSS